MESSSNYQQKPLTNGRTFFLVLREIFRKQKAVWLLFFLAFFSISTVQGQISVLELGNQPELLDLRTCNIPCSSGNYDILEVFLSDEYGNRLADQFATCTAGVTQTAYVSFLYETNSGSSTNNGRLFADVVFTNPQTGEADSIFLNYYFGEIPAAKAEPQVITIGIPFQWTCGVEVQFLNPLLAWTTSATQDLSLDYECNDYPSAQCQFGGDTVVSAPLAVQFTYAACTVDDVTTASFFNNTNGGTTPYTYSWTFSPNATPSSSSEENPTVSFTGTGPYTARLEVTDAANISNFFETTFNKPGEITYDVAFTNPTGVLNNGSITISNVQGGTGDKTISWEDDPSITTYTRTGLGAGLYIAQIIDEFNCIKLVPVTLTAEVPSINLVKIGVLEDTNGDGLNSAGDRINYSFVITNDGDVPLTGVDLDDQDAVLTGTSFDLAPGEINSTSYTGVYTLTQADIEAGFFTNTATVTATGGGVEVNDSDSHTENFTQVARMVATKNQTGGPNPVTAASQTIDYTITIENTGNLNLTNVVGRDFAPGDAVGVILTLDSGDNGDGILNPGETWTYLFSYTVSQSDMNLGDNLVNVVNFSSDQVPGPVTANASTPIQQNPSLSIDKQVVGVDEAGNGLLDEAGDLIEYEIVVTNTGNVTLTNVTIVDPLTGTNKNIGDLAPGATHTESTSYAITQEDLNTRGGGDGDIDNTATADSDQAGPVEDSESVDLVYAPQMNITKTAVGVDEAGDGVLNAAGDLIDYEIEVTNDGNVTLTNVTVNDPLTGGLLTTIVSLAPNASETVNVSYAITQDDLDNNGNGDPAGFIYNTATADSDQTGEEAASEEVPLTQTPVLSITKTAVGIDEAGDGVLNEAGDLIDYEIEVTNDGNVTLTNVTIVDPLTGTDVNIGDLAPGASHTESTSYAITQNDLDTNGGGDGDIDNTATADSDQTGEETASEEVPLTQNPVLSITKTAVGVDAAGDGVLNEAGDIIDYEIEVTNDGNVTLTNVMIVDPLTGTDVNIGDLAPGASHTESISYAITQEDLDTRGGGDGDIDNTATADSDQAGPVEDSEAVDLVYDPVLSITKTAVAVDDAGDGILNNADEVIDYEIVVTNDGNVTLTNVTVIDPLTGTDV
ncbi:DUF11 domain-containing protein, partial [Algoriphagus kandeliae]